MNNNFEQDADKERALTIATSAITTDVFNGLLEVGQLQATLAIGDMLSVGALVKLQQLKDSKGYLRLKGQKLSRSGTDYDLGTWEGFCQSLGKSSRHIDEKLAELNMLGEDAFANAKSIGITTSNLRKLRKLDDNDQKVIIGEIEASIGDKDAILELIEDMSVKHSKVKSKLENQLKDLNAEAKAKDRVIADKQKTIDDKNTELNIKDEKLALRSHAPAFERAKDYATQMDVFKIDSLQLFGNISALYEQIEQDDELPELLRVNMGHLLLEVKAQANNLIDHHMLGDVSVDDDDLSWMHNANAEIEARNQVIDVSGLSSDAARFQEWKTEQGYVSDDDDFALQGQTADEIANPPKGE